MSIRKHLLNLHLFLQREFVSNSKEYFEKRFFKAYNLISFKEEELFYTNEFDIKLNSFFNQYPFMSDFLSYRKKVKSLDDYCNICFNVINEHFIQVKKNNTLYSNDLLQNKDETVAYNIVKHQRNDFFNKIRTIFYIIEKSYSLELLKTIKDAKNSNIYIENDTNKILEKTKLEDFFTKPIKKVINGLIQINFLNEEGKFIYDKKRANYTQLSILTAKLEDSKCIIFDSNDYKVNHEYYRIFFDTNFNYDNSTSHRKRVFDNDEDLGNYQKFYDKLSFLDNL